MKVKIINPIADKRWDSFVSLHPDALIYHTSAWAEVIIKTYRYVPEYIVLEDGGIKAGLPLFYIKSPLTRRKLSSLPFSDTSFPLVREEINIKSMIDLAVDTGKKNRCAYLELRGEIEDERFERFDYYKTFLLDLSQSVDSIWKNLQKETIKRSIRKAEKSEIEIYFAKEDSDILNFYHLNLLTRKKHGVIPQPLSFFVNLWKILRHKGFLELILAKYKGKSIAGIVIFKFKDRAYYKYGASDSKYLWLRPNHLLMWEAIKSAKKENYKIFDFGRASPDNKGLMKFKRGWGTEEIPLIYSYYPTVRGFATTQEGSFKYRLVSNLIKKVPISISKRVGDILYRYLG